MERERQCVELMAGEEVPPDCRWLVRGGAYWVVAPAGDGVRVGRVAPAGRGEGVVAWRDGVFGGGARYASPVPGGGVAVGGPGTVTVYEADGRERWAHGHPAWDGVGACTADPAGAHLFAVVPAAAVPGRDYPGEVCVALDLVTGKPVAAVALPGSGATYAFQQSLAPRAREVQLNVIQGQGQGRARDAAHALLVELYDGTLHTVGIGRWDEPFAGPGLVRDDFLKVAADGSRLARHRPGRHLSRHHPGHWTPVEASAADLLPDGLLLAGRPGFLDRHRILAAAAGAPDARPDAPRHVLLDARTLRPVAELAYPGTSCPDPVPLAEGAWLTLTGDTVDRRRPDPGPT
ncbi:hypothetical protein [Streptomyces sp. NPDC090022]|uniref:hypothetical protein n=1 Tax=Streptomyces sp. NPDC090022 TaxID=3365920 RepID=UPI0038271935